MTGHRGSTGLQGAVDWTKFAQPQDVPDWISKAYADTYQGPHDDQPVHDRGSGVGPTAAAAVTPALLAAHYRLGLHRPTGESRVAVYPSDDPGGFGPALQCDQRGGGTAVLDAAHSAWADAAVSGSVR